MQTCRACGSYRLNHEGRTRDAQHDHAHWYRCADCGSLTNGISYDEIKWLYSDEWTTQAVDSGFYPDWQTCVDSFASHVNRMKLVQEPPASVLDVGCLDGSFLVAMQAAGYECYGFDVVPRAAEFAAERLGVGRERFSIEPEFNPFAYERKFDLVHSSEVIEHVDRPAELLRTMRHACKNGGHLFIQTPCADGTENRIFDQTAHLCILSPGAIRVMMKATGWEVIERLTHLWPGGQLYVAKAV